jgi:hypothetical protein
MNSDTSVATPAIVDPREVMARCRDEKPEFFEGYGTAIMKNAIFKNLIPGNETVSAGWLWSLFVAQILIVDTSGPERASLKRRSKPFTERGRSSPSMRG